MNFTSFWFALYTLIYDPTTNFKKKDTFLSGVLKCLIKPVYLKNIFFFIMFCVCSQKDWILFADSTFIVHPVSFAFLITCRINHCGSTELLPTPPLTDKALAYTLLAKENMKLCLLLIRFFKILLKFFFFLSFKSDVLS